MEKREFKVGDKVKIPKTKNARTETPLHKSSAILNAKEINQDFLYIIQNDHPEYILGVNLNSRESTFHFQDLEHYKEFPEKWAIKLYPEVKQWIEDEHRTNCYSKDSKNHIFHFPNWENGNGFSIGAHTDNGVRKGYTLITLKQFQKCVLKEKEMERKIKGYVLIKEYPGSKGLGYFEKYTTGELNKYPEFWEPVYEEEFKVGDWVTFEIDKCVGRLSRFKSQHWDRNITVPIDHIIHNSFGFNEDTMNKYAPHAYWSGASNDKEVFRKATPEEIEAAEAARKTIIKMHSSNKGEFEIEIMDGKAYYRPENKELPKEWIKDIIDIFGEQGGINYPYKLEVKSVKVGCMEGTRREDWLKVYNILK